MVIWKDIISDISSSQINNRSTLVRATNMYMFLKALVELEIHLLTDSIT